jgi:hypothetical protein
MYKTAIKTSDVTFAKDVSANMTIDEIFDVLQEKENIEKTNIEKTKSSTIEHVCDTSHVIANLHFELKSYWNQFGFMNTSDFDSFSRMMSKNMRFVKVEDPEPDLETNDE